MDADRSEGPKLKIRGFGGIAGPVAPTDPAAGKAFGRGVWGYITLGGDTQALELQSRFFGWRPDFSPEQHKMAQNDFLLARDFSCSFFPFTLTL